MLILIMSMELTKNNQKNYSLSKDNTNFRILAKRIFLTYSRCPDYWTKEMLKGYLIDNILSYQTGKKIGQSKVKSWIIAKESHLESMSDKGDGKYGRGIHFHCLIEGKEKIDIKNPRMLDIEGLHGNYQPVKHIWQVLNYIKKHGDWIAEGFPGMKSENLSILNAKTEIDAKLQLMDKMSVKDKLDLRNQIVTRTERKTIIEEVITKAPLFAFQELMMPFAENSGFTTKGRAMGIVMSGESNSGKTTMGYRIAKELDQDLAIYRDPREMLNYNEEQVIMFDEMTKEDFKANRGFLAMLVTEPDAKTKAYYGSKKVKWPRKVLIATNEDVEKWEWDEATRSRFIVIKTKADNTYEFYMFKEKELQLLTTEEVKDLIKGSKGNQKEE